MSKPHIYHSEMVVYLTFTSAGLELMAGTRELDSDIRAIFRDLSAMRVYHAGAIAQAMGDGRSSWVYDKWFDVFAFPNMTAADILPAIETLRNMDTYAIDSPYTDPDQIKSYFIDAKKSLETQRMILNTIRASLEEPRGEHVYICRNCGHEFKGEVWREGRDADKCQICGAAASTLRASANWKIYI